MELDELFHALRGSLTILRSNIFLLEVNSGDVSVKSMKKSVDDMTRAVKNYEVIKKHQDYTSEQSRSFVVLQKVIDEILRSIDSKLAQRVVFEDKTAPFTLLADEGYLRLVLNELMLNAQVFSEGRITVKITGSEKHRTFSVTTSSTLNKGEIENIREPFYTSEIHKKQGRAGTGLGLAMVESVARYNGWDLRFESGKTTKVSIVF